jgi:hypothetical protein
MRTKRGFTVLAFLLIGFCLLPHALFVGAYGRLPLYNSNAVQEGMTREEILDRCGKPHMKHDEGDREVWYYWTSVFEITYIGMRFSPDGKVEFVWI